MGERPLQQRRQQAAAVHAHLCHRAVRAVEEAVVQQEGGTVRQQGVTLHLAEADATLDVAASHRLVGHLVPGACGPHLELVGDHVAQPLVVHHANEDVRLQFDTTDPAVEALGAVVVVAGGAQHLAEVLQRRAVLGECEGRGVVAQAVQGARLTRHALNQHADGHTRREAVRVEQDVRAHAALCEGHVLSGPQAAEDALLAVAARELVADGGVARHSHRDAHALEASRAHVIAADFDVVHHAGLLAPVGRQNYMLKLP